MPFMARLKLIETVHEIENTAFSVLKTSFRTIFIHFKPKKRVAHCFHVIDTVAKTFHLNSVLLGLIMKRHPTDG